MSYRVSLEPPAEKKLAKLDRPWRERVVKRLRELASDPFDPRISKPLKGAIRLRSSRVGDRRIIYAVNTDEQAIHILSVNPRGAAYRNL